MKRQGINLAARVLFATAVLLLLAGAGCREEKQSKAPATQKLDIDTLRSMPYAGSAQIAEGEGDGVVFADVEHVCPGYNLYTIQPLSAAELIDNEGSIIRRWQDEDSERWVRSVLLPGGDLIVVGADPTHLSNAKGTGPILDEARYIARYDWSGRRLWKRKITAHHDIAEVDNGRLLTITLQRRMLPHVNPNVQTRDDLVTMLDSTGSPIKSMSLFDAINRKPLAFRFIRVKPSGFGGEDWVDLFHTNSVQWIDAKRRAGIHAAHRPNRILTCSRHQNRIAVFDWKEQRIEWSWGKNELDGPHDAQVLPNGNILIFDNGLARGWSRVIELDPDTEKIVWSYQAEPREDFYTASKGSAQRLPNGNTLIAESDKGRAFEITPLGDIVWEFLCPHRVADDERAAIVRIRRLPIAFVESILKAEREATETSDGQ